MDQPRTYTLEDAPAPFQIEAAIEQTPFQEEITQWFFKQWCEMNDSITPRFISRDIWNAKHTDEKMLTDNRNGTKTLWLPADLHLWEMVEVIAVIDRDTFANKPELREQKKLELLHLAELFQKSGAYIARYGQESASAQALGLQLYAYGNSLETGKKQNTQEYASDLEDFILTDDEKTATEFFLATGMILPASSIHAVQCHVIGDETLTPDEQREANDILQMLPKGNIYPARIKKIAKRAADPSAYSAYLKAQAENEIKKDNEIQQETDVFFTLDESERKSQLTEQTRAETTKQFFSAMDKALRLTKHFEGKRAQEEKKETSAIPGLSFHEAYLARMDQKMKSQAEAPKHELIQSIFNRGQEKLAEEMRESHWSDAFPKPMKKILYQGFAKLGIDLAEQERRIADILKIQDLKKDLQTVRATEDKDAISEKEIEIARRVQEVIRGFFMSRYEDGDINRGPRSYSPAKIIEKKYLNCIGYALLGEALLKEVGIKYVAAVQPYHRATFVITTNGQVLWQDMQGRLDSIINLNDSDLESATIKDIVRFSQYAKEGSMSFNLKSERCKTKAFYLNDQIGYTFELLSPKVAILSGFLNLEDYLREKLQLPNEADEFIKQAIAINPRNSGWYRLLADSLLDTNKKEEAIKVYKKAMHLTSEKDFFYGECCYHLNQKEQAVLAYQKALANKSTYRAEIYARLCETFLDLGQKEDAKNAFNNYLALVDRKDKNIKEYIKYIQSLIDKLQK